MLCDLIDKLETVEAEFRTCTIDFIILLSFSFKDECTIVFLILCDTIEVCQSCTIFFNIEFLTAIENYSHFNKAVLVRLNGVECAAGFIAVSAVTYNTESVYQ